MQHSEIETHKKAELFANNTIRRLKQSENNAVVLNLIECLHVHFKVIMGILDDLDRRENRE